MPDRLKSLKRVLAVQNQVVKLAEWKLAGLKKEGAELEADQARLHEFVSGGEPLSPLLSAAAFVRGQTINKAIAKCATDTQAQSAHADAMKRREKLAEKLVKNAKVDAEREREKRQLQEVLEAALWRDDASFP